MEGSLHPPADPGFRLIETGLWTPETGLHHRALHLGRLARSAARLGITPHGVDDVLATVTGNGAQRLRLTVDVKGQPQVETSSFTPLPEDITWKVQIASQRLNPDNPWLSIKTTERQLYDHARAELPDTADEMIFLNQRDEVCEGTITNIFADLGQGLVTPPATSGLLPGILRQHLLNGGQAREQVLDLSDLRNARALYVGNALRGLIAAALPAD